MITITINGKQAAQISLGIAQLVYQGQMPPVEGLELVTLIMEAMENETEETK